MAEPANPIFARLLSLSVAMVCILLRLRSLNFEPNAGIHRRGIRLCRRSVRRASGDAERRAAAKWSKPATLSLQWNVAWKPPPAIRRPASSPRHRPIWKTRKRENGRVKSSRCRRRSTRLERRRHFRKQIWRDKKNLPPPMRASNRIWIGRGRHAIRIVSASRRWKPI